MAVTSGSTDTSGGTLAIRLFDPGMTPLHRVGLGGLWMTLRVMEAEHPELQEALYELGGRWATGAQGVEFTWTGDGRGFFQRLIQESFRLTEDGRFWFLGLGHPDDQGDGGVTLQEALLNTFLQHGRTRKADPSNRPSGAITLETDGQSRGMQFRRVSFYAHQWEGVFQPKDSNPVAGWQFPGGAVRHVAFSAATELKEPPGRWLALLFAPVGAVYFRIRRRTQGVRPQFCLVLSEVGDLETFAQARHLFLRASVRARIVSGTADAALRVMAELQAADLLEDLRSCRCSVASFGVAPWASQQKTRVDVFDIQGLSSSGLRIHRRALQLFPVLPVPEGPARNLQQDQEEPAGQLRWETNPVLDLMARNLVRGHPWWRDFASLVANVESRMQMSRYEYIRRSTGRPVREGGLPAMVADPDALGSKGAETIVRACHEAWRRRMGALIERAESRGERFYDLIDRERERLRISLAHCKNAATLRGVLTDFWSRAGGPYRSCRRGGKPFCPI
ncbi:MAG TPA: type I-MYXAN CRISPR-associated Cas8a1/Cmx1 [Dehalococcoidia bacterium]|jgi:CRISPR-associated protein Cas8a1/Csx13|nr:type I-MYXAN CRISPR-associated Cas8a1/Cmx1 [Dehalococcoidia bacterium]